MPADLHAAHVLLVEALSALQIDKAGGEARLLGRIDALLATSALAAEAAEARFPGEYRSIPLGVDSDLAAVDLLRLTATPVVKCRDGALQSRGDLPPTDSCIRPAG